MPAVTSNPYKLEPGNTNEGTLTFPLGKNYQLAIEITANGFQFNTIGATGASSPTYTSASGNKIVISLDEGSALAYKANNSASVAFISW